MAGQLWSSEGMKNIISVLICILGVSMFARGSELKVGDAAPEVKLQTDEGKPFDLAQRKGQWTVLYFYPKAETPGCTKQACAFRDSISKIHELKAEVYGVSDV